MTWDNWKRLNLFCGHSRQDVEDHYTKDDAYQKTLFNDLGVEVNRLALNRDQIEKHSPPPNPAKSTDTRILNYVRLYGENSWELDALDPVTLSGLIERAVLDIRDDGLWNRAVERQEKDRAELADFCDRLHDE